MPAEQIAPPSPPGGVVERSGPPTPPGEPVVGGVIDSILPIPEAIERFRKRVGVIPARLGGEPSRDALVRRWVTAVERADTLALARLLLSAGEYIAFYYPESPYTEPPYRQAPDIRWLLIQSGSDQGITRVLRRHGGGTIGFQGYRCGPRPDTVGRNRIWSECVVRFTEEGKAVERRLFGPILEREGRFKFLSYAADY